MANLSIQDSTINFLISVEGFAPRAFWDVKQWSIGYGTGIMPDGRKVRAGDTVTREQARQMLYRDAPIRGAVVNKLVASNLSQNQFDALVSFVYNVGETNFKTSTLLKKVNANPNDLEAIEFQFLQWDNADGKFNQGVLNRRKKEIALYTNGTAEPANFFFIILVIAIVLLMRKK